MTADIVVPNLEARAFQYDFETLRGLSENLSSHSPLGNLARITANEIMNTFSVNDPASLKRCRKLAEKVLGRDWEAELSKARGKDGVDADGTLWAIGHCHIDTACKCESREGADSRVMAMGGDEEEGSKVLVDVRVLNFADVLLICSQAN